MDYAEGRCGHLSGLISRTSGFDSRLSLLDKRSLHVLSCAYTARSYSGPIRQVFTLVTGVRFSVALLSLHGSYGKDTGLSNRVKLGSNPRWSILVPRLVPGAFFVLGLDSDQTAWYSGSMNVSCSNIFGHKFPDVKLSEDTMFHRVDCERKHCNYSMDAVAFKLTLDRLSDGPLKRRVEKIGPRIVMHDR